MGGTGALGSGLATRWAAAGYPVVLGSRSREKGAASAAAVKVANGAPPVRGDGNEGAARAADIVVIAVPYSSHAATLDEIREAV
ncbi:MAG TPA: NAD(P)-binding domain-containing protein, partial [Burkholderiales bacterium]|nr:NAD(P)-binding domain-containing protein [Burkholderiales bacterium]